MRKLGGFIKETYLPAARQDIGASGLPDGEAFYQYSIRRQTTTGLTAKQIHEIGLKEVARIRREMEDVIAKASFKGSFGDFLTFLRTDPRFYYTKAGTGRRLRLHRQGLGRRVAKAVRRAAANALRNTCYSGLRRTGANHGLLSAERGRRLARGLLHDQHLQARYAAEV